MITAEQIRAARALLRLEQAQLAEKSDISVETIKRLERQSGDVKAKVGTTYQIEEALRREGIEFIEGGVRLVPDKTKFLQEQLSKEVGHSIGAMLEMHVLEDPNFFERDLDHITSTVIASVELLFRRYLIQAIGPKITIPLGPVEGKPIGPKMEIKTQPISHFSRKSVRALIAGVLDQEEAQQTRQQTRKTKKRI